MSSAVAFVETDWMYSTMFLALNLRIVWGIYISEPKRDHIAEPEEITHALKQRRGERNNKLTDSIIVSGLLNVQGNSSQGVVCCVARNPSSVQCACRPLTDYTY